jgi:DNA-binding MarR family transcriptional regulator
MRSKPGIGTLLRGLIYQLDNDLDATYEARGLAFRARFYPIFRHVSEVGPCPMRDLVTVTGTTFSAVSQTITQMEKSGLLNLEAGEDKRVRIVSLSEQSEIMKPALKAIWDQVDKAHKELDIELGIELQKVLEDLTVILEKKSLFQRINPQQSS